MNRRKPLSRYAPLPRRKSPLKRLGKKGKAWANTRRKVKGEFFRQGITACETCGADNFLTFAHRMKRRLIDSPAELATVALLCASCHNRIEVLPHAAMFVEVTDLIAARFDLREDF